MPTKRENDDERIARLEQLIEEYRVKTEDTHQQIDRLRGKLVMAKRQGKIVRTEAKRTRAARRKA